MLISCLPSKVRLPPGAASPALEAGSPATSAQAAPIINDLRSKSIIAPGHPRRWLGDSTPGRGRPAATRSDRHDPWGFCYNLVEYRRIVQAGGGSFGPGGQPAGGRAGHGSDRTQRDPGRAPPQGMCSPVRACWRSRSVCSPCLAVGPRPRTMARASRSSRARSDRCWSSGARSAIRPHWPGRRASCGSTRARRRGGEGPRDRRSSPGTWRPARLPGDHGGRRLLADASQGEAARAGDRRLPPVDRDGPHPIPATDRRLRPRQRRPHRPTAVTGGRYGRWPVRPSRPSPLP